MAREIILRNNDLKQLSACYIFCTNKEPVLKWSQEYPKVLGVFTRLNRLLSQILNDQTHREKSEEHASISVIQCRSKSAEEKNAIYMWFQLYIEVLLRMHHKINDREELVDVYRRSIVGSKQEKHELQLIEQFEKDYKSEEAIWWYTKESSLYRILNRALREQDFDQLFASRVLITDIAKQISNQYEKYVRTNNTREPFQLCRGQLIEYDELEAMRENKGEYISMTSFFSTSLDRSVVLEEKRDENDVRSIAFIFPSIHEVVYRYIYDG